MKSKEKENKEVSKRQSIKEMAKKKSRICEGKISNKSRDKRQKSFKAKVKEIANKKSNKC